MKAFHENLATSVVPDSTLKGAEGLRITLPSTASLATIFCPVCKKGKSTENFYRNAARKNGRENTCKECVSRKKVPLQAKTEEKC